MDRPEYEPLAEIAVDEVSPSRQGFTLTGQGRDHADYHMDLRFEMPLDVRTRAVLGELLSARGSPRYRERLAKPGRGCAGASDPRRGRDRGFLGGGCRGAGAIRGPPRPDRPGRGRSGAGRRAGRVEGEGQGGAQPQAQAGPEQIGEEEAVSPLDSAPPDQASQFLGR